MWRVTVRENYTDKHILNRLHDVISIRRRNVTKIDAGKLEVAILNQGAVPNLCSLGLNKTLPSLKISSVPRL